MVFIEARPFTRRLRELAGASEDEVLRSIQYDLLKDPYRGALVRGLGGIRKARQLTPRVAKASEVAFDICTYILEYREHVHLLLLLDKNEQEDISQPERTMLRALVRQITQEGGPHGEAN